MDWFSSDSCLFPARCVLLSGLWLGSAAGAAQAAERDAAGLEFFEKQVRPILVQHCYECHGENKQNGGLRLDTRDGWSTGGDSGPAILPGQPDESLLIQAIRYRGDYDMPPKGKLPAEIIQTFERWVALGAPDPRVAVGHVKAPPGIDLEAGRQHWAYRPVARPKAPHLRDAAWSRGTIDRWILAGLENASLQPATDADRIVLIRRSYFDLLGIPPTPEEMDEFVENSAPDAYSKLIDRLLASPRFGERWGRHWLDVARFAESITLRGFVFKEAWRYRDYVINARNEDQPFDQFLREQIAGDLLPAATRAERTRQLVATTYLALGNNNLEEQDKKQLEMDVIDEQLDLICKGILAQTVTCARCHDHKFDPIPQRDYYALAGILRNTQALEHANVSKWVEAPLPDEPEREKLFQQHAAAIAALQERISAARKAVKLAAGTGSAAVPPLATTEAELKTLENQLKKLVDSTPYRPMTMTVFERPEIRDTPIQIRGIVHNVGEMVPRGFLQVCSAGTAVVMPAHQSGRAELADWLASREQPLTARVMVNRIWQTLFGAGIVRTVDNFGLTGELPSHPDLLDDLAQHFMESGWSVKEIVRKIVLSRSYCQKSKRLDSDRIRTSTVDPENRLLAGVHRRRLDAESIRDAILSVSGQIRLDSGGPTFPAELDADYGFQHSGTRRSVYEPVFRNSLPEIFEAFDFADPSTVTGHRSTSTVAPQALFLMNSPFVLEQAAYAAQRLLADSSNNTMRQLELLFRRCLGRLPTDREKLAACSFLAIAGDGKAADSQSKNWTQLCQILFASIDFRYIE